MPAPPDRPSIRALDYLTPTAVLLVSRAWVLREVGAVADLDDGRRAQLADELSAYEPERRNGLRNNFIAWLIMLGGAGLASLIGLPAWLGFAGGVLIVLAMARALATRALRWRLAQLIDPDSR